MRRGKLRVKGVSSTAELKSDIQELVRAIVIARDGNCILRSIRLCADPVLQADHLVSRANSATFADTRLIVCVCRSCHGWKHYHEKEYEKLVRKILPKERVKLWDKAEEFRSAHKTYKMDWAAEIINLRRELKKYV